ncbi:MAG: hypothetical protein F4Y07_11685, partial [Gemmatimonadetes bacterium]|nr:hypothetical protein [Gemmatimonadota bacterium]
MRVCGIDMAHIVPMGPRDGSEPKRCRRRWPGRKRRIHSETPMNHSPIARVAAEVRSGATTARSLAEDAIRSYEASDLGAYIAFDAEGARRRADAVDAAVARGEDPGPLAGVTVSVKDLYGVEGLPIRAGTRRELPDRWQREGFLVRSLRRLGAVVVGKTHTVELAFGGIGLN